MNIRQHVGPDGMVELQFPDGKTIRRWPIDAKDMIAKGGARIAGAAPASALSAVEPGAPGKPDGKPPVKTDGK